MCQSASLLECWCSIRAPVTMAAASAPPQSERRVIWINVKNLSSTPAETSLVTNATLAAWRYYKLTISFLSKALFYLSKASARCATWCLSERTCAVVKGRRAWRSDDASTPRRSIWRQRLGGRGTIPDADALDRWKSAIRTRSSPVEPKMVAVHASAQSVASSEWIICLDKRWDRQMRWNKSDFRSVYFNVRRLCNKATVAECVIPHPASAMHHLHPTGRV